MKITKITFQQTFPTAQFANQKLGVEIDISGDDLTTAFKQAKEMVNNAFEAMNPGIQWMEPACIEEPQPKIINLEVERLEIAIENAKTREELKCFFDDIIKIGNPQLGTFYNQKLKELSL